MRARVIVCSEEDVHVAGEATGVTSQGKTVKEAIENFREALELYLEEVPEVLEKHWDTLDRDVESSGGLVWIVSSCMAN